MMDLDGYSEFLNISKKSTEYKNVYKILFYPIEIDSYMEKHGIYEIIEELLIRSGIERPSSDKIIDFFIAKLLEISENFQKKNNLKIEFNNCKDESLKMLKKLSKIHKISLFYEDSSEIPSTINISCDFKEPNNPDCGKYMTILTDNDRNNNNINNIHKSLECNLKLKEAAIHSKLCYNNLKHVIQNVHLTNPLRRAHGKWNYRVLVVGRTGSGRKTQAKHLANEFGLVFINFDEIQHKQQLSDALGYLQEMILKPQCLHNGYVIVSDVINIMDLDVIMEKFIHRPNLIIFIHTNEERCRRRIQKDIERVYRGNVASCTQPACVYDEKYLDFKMNLYDLHKKEFLRYFTSTTRDLKDKIYHVNGNGSVHDVRSYIWARICRV